MVLAQSTLQPMVLNDAGTFIVSGATSSLRGGAIYWPFPAQSLRYGA